MCVQSFVPLHALRIKKTLGIFTEMKKIQMIPTIEQLG